MRFVPTTFQKLEKEKKKKKGRRRGGNQKDQIFRYTVLLLGYVRLKANSEKKRTERGVVPKSPTKIKYRHVRS